MKNSSSVFVLFMLSLHEPYFRVPTKTLCKMEMHLLVNVFDLQFHNIMHVVEDVEMAGSVLVRWMYHVEQFLKVLKDYIRQQAQPEGSIAEGYITVETMFFVYDYAQRLHKNNICLGKSIEEDPKLQGIVLPKRGSFKLLSPILKEQVHQFLIFNMPFMEPWREQYVREFEGVTEKPSITKCIFPIVQDAISRK